MTEDITYKEIAREIEDIQGRIRRLAHHAPNNPEIQTRFSTANKRLETARRYSVDHVVPSDGAIQEREATAVPVQVSSQDGKEVGT